MALIPLYFQVERKLREKIRTREIVRADGILPSEERLCSLLGVSRITVRKALSELALEGLIVRKPGKGTFLLPPKKQIVSQLYGNFEGLLANRAHTRIQVLKQTLINPPADVQKKLELKGGQKAFRYEGLRFLNRKPYSSFTIYVSGDVVKLFSSAELKGQTMLHKSIEEATGIRMVEVDQTITVSTADGKTARALRMKPGDPVLFVERVYFTYGRKPVELAISSFHPDLYQYRIKLIRGKSTPAD